MWLVGKQNRRKLILFYVFYGILRVLVFVLVFYGHFQGDVFLLLRPDSSRNFFKI